MRAISCGVGFAGSITAATKAIQPLHKSQLAGRQLLDARSRDASVADAAAGIVTWAGPWMASALALASASDRTT